LEILALKMETLGRNVLVLLENKYGSATISEMADTTRPSILFFIFSGCAAQCGLASSFHEVS
jgi:cytochrome oxidase Cu insertion factor (SCO1/SenC/PrrC family)